MIAADTDLTPIDLGSYSSRVTFMAGNAALRAAEDVKKNIVSAAAKRMECALRKMSSCATTASVSAGTTLQTMILTASDSLENRKLHAAMWMARYCAARSCRRARKRARRST